DTFKPATTECRAVAGNCDVAENCTGSGPSCPSDSFKPSTTTCRPSAGDCDVAESCTGSGAACPADTFEPATTACRPVAGDGAELPVGWLQACQHHLSSLGRRLRRRRELHRVGAELSGRRLRTGDHRVPA